MPPKRLKKHVCAVGLASKDPQQRFRFFTSEKKPDGLVMEFGLMARLLSKYHRLLNCQVERLDNNDVFSLNRGSKTDQLFHSFDGPMLDFGCINLEYLPSVFAVS